MDGSSHWLGLHREMNSRTHQVIRWFLFGSFLTQIFCHSLDLKDTPDVVNDLDIDFFNNPDAARAALNDIRNHRKIREITQKLQIHYMNPLRQGTRLLVLDIDYTILDTKPLTSQSLPPIECARPHLHEFLARVYPYYDICIWSQTSWVWIETKLAELGMIGVEQPYKVLLLFLFCTIS